MQALARRLATATRRPWPERPVRVALVITELDVGGAEKALVALATGLDRGRWEPAVIGLGPEGELAGPLRGAGIETRCLGVDRTRPIGAVARLTKAFREIQPALVQSFLFHANIAARLAAPFAGRPWVVGGLRVAERGKRWHSWIDRATIGMACGSVCVSEGVRSFARDVAGLPADRLTVIPNGVDPAPIDRAEPVARGTFGVPDESHVAVFVGRLDRQKGVSVLLDAAAIVVRSRPDWHLAIVGDGAEGNALRERTNMDDLLRNRVHWLGRRGDVPGLLKGSDVVVLPSLWEGMPNVVLEAMAARRAVVATAVEGTTELVEPGRTGWLVAPGDAGGLAAALLDAASDASRRAAFGAAGRARVEALASPRTVVDAYERLWAGVLGLEMPGETMP
ncbi:MAG TPA: glycosyltransferase [Isosphaeraceae bacterium]|nr:glycosyltransferase [Isosphaeraceae bacterium]